MTPCDTSAASAFGHGLIQPASPNSAVQMTSIDSRSMSLSDAASRRTSCSRCWVASAGSGSTTTRYSPFAASVHAFAAAGNEPPFCGAVYQWRVGVDSAPAPPPHPVSPSASRASAPAPQRSRRLIMHRRRYPRCGRHKPVSAVARLNAAFVARHGRQQLVRSGVHAVAPRRRRSCAIARRTRP